MSRQIAIPELSLIALVGVSGSGKSSFARRHFAPTQVMSSDFFRGLVSDDENDQSVSGEAFDALFYVAAKRLAAGHRTVIDATNLRPDDRRKVVALAREHDVLPVAIVLDVPESVCAERNATRPNRDMPPHVIPRQARELRRSLRGLEKEGFRGVHILRGVDEIESVAITYDRLYNDRRELTAPFDIIGDIHGCQSELEALLTRLGYEIGRDDAGRAVGATHPAGRTTLLVGDLVDRGPDTPGGVRGAGARVGASRSKAVENRSKNASGDTSKEPVGASCGGSGWTALRPDGAS